MKSLLKFAFVCVFVAGVTVGDAYAQFQPVPQQLNVQGVLRNVTGEVVTGPYNIKFSLWDSAVGGSELCDQTIGVDVIGGVFNAYVTNCDVDNFKDRSQVYLQIQIGPDVLSRRPFTSVGFAFQAEHAEECDTLLGAATDLDCDPDGCVGATDLSITWAEGTYAGGPAADLDCTDCVGAGDIAPEIVTGGTDVEDGHIAGSTIKSWNLDNNAVTTAKIDNDAVDSNKLKDDSDGNPGAVGTNHIQDEAVTNAKIATGTITGGVGGNIGFNYADSNAKGGPAIGLECGSACVGSGEVDFCWAESEGTYPSCKGGAAKDLSCAGTHCVAKEEVNFCYAGSAGAYPGCQGAAAADLDCTDCVGAGEVQFSYAAGTGEAGDATGLICTGCVHDTDLNLDYAAGRTAHGAATDVDCRDAGDGKVACVESNEVAFNYAGSGSKGGDATGLDCTGCVGTTQIDGGAVTNVKITGPVEGDKIEFATNIQRGVARFGTGLLVNDGGDGSDALVYVNFGETADTVAEGNHDHGDDYVPDGGPYTLTHGETFTLEHNNPAGDFAYFLNPGSVGSDNIAFRLALGNDWDETERFEIHTTSGTFTGITHRLAANGNAYHKGTVTIDGDLDCPGGGCVSSSDIINESITGTDIDDGSIGGGDLASNITISTTSTITAANMYASRYYDADDNAFYADPNGTSEMNRIDFANLYLNSDNNYGFIGDRVYANVINTGIGGDNLQIQFDKCGDVDMFHGTCGGETLDVNGNVEAYDFLDRDDNTYHLDPTGNSRLNEVYADGWFRAYGNHGLYFQNWGGGWYMSDTTWVRSYNNKPVYTANEMRATSFTDANDSTYYVDPNGTSLIRKLSVNDGTTACCGYYTVSINDGTGHYPTLQFHDSGVADGFVDLRTVGNGGGKGFYFHGNQSGSSIRATDYVIGDDGVRGPVFYDTSGTSCQADPNGTSRIERLELDGTVASPSTGLRVETSTHLGETNISRLRTDWAYFGGTTNFNGDIRPYSDNAHVLGFWYYNDSSYGITYNNSHVKHQRRHFYAVTSRRYWTYSSENVKHDIKDLTDDDYAWTLDKLRESRSIFYRYDDEHGNIEDAEVEADRRIASQMEDLREQGIEDSADDLIDRGKEIDMRYRPASRIGFVSQTLPAELWVGGRDNEGYSMGDAIGFLWATNKALDRQNQEMEQRVVDLEDRIALMEQLLVDEGILK